MWEQNALKQFYLWMHGVQVMHNSVLGWSHLIWHQLNLQSPVPVLKKDVSGKVSWEKIVKINTSVSGDLMTMCWWPEVAAFLCRGRSRGGTGTRRGSAWLILRRGSARFSGDFIAMLKRSFSFGRSFLRLLNSSLLCELLIAFAVVKKVSR